MPFLQIPSGHHQVADCLMEELERSLGLRCEKADILAYGYGKIESFVSNIYLKWIACLPELYNSVYRFTVCRNPEQTKRYRLYEWIFVYFMKRLLTEKMPDLLVCTHALPSYLANLLKERKQLAVPVVNVYTDFFIHNLWGIKHIDYHFVSTGEMKEMLRKMGVPGKRIFVTGIPVHRQFKNRDQQPVQRRRNTASKVLICGGNLGVGGLEELIEEIKDCGEEKKMQFYILCGKNNKLYKKLKAMDQRHIIPFPYIHCRKEMNRLYDEADVIITKPGGITISESLVKRKPIFIYDALPGQERINFRRLLGLGVVFPLQKGKICEDILATLADQAKMDYYYRRVECYHAEKTKEEPFELIADILERSGVDGTFVRKKGILLFE